MSSPQYKFACSSLLLLIVLVAGCRNAPITERKQLMLLPEDHEIVLGAATYREVITQEKLSNNRRYIEMLNRVGQRIARVANRPDYQWEFQVIDSPQQNAFCLPGGKVAVYEGIMPICEDEAGLAVVVSHEIAHALARHGGERMSHQMVSDGMSTVVNHVTRKQEEYNKELIQQAYGAASEYGVVLPFSREHEAEADSIGLLLMAKAGYDPSVAPSFWRRFAVSSEGAKQPEFFSTHPSDERRADEIEQALPEALAMYQEATSQFGRGEMIAVRNPPQPTNPMWPPQHQDQRAAQAPPPQGWTPNAPAIR